MQGQTAPKWFAEIGGSQSFFEGAEYRSDYLNLSGDDGYIGVGVDGTFSATDALLDTVDNSVLKLSEVNTPTLGAVSLVKLATMDGEAIEFGARATTAVDSNSTKALRAAFFDDLADKKGFRVSIDALITCTLRMLMVLTLAHKKSSSSYTGCCCLWSFYVGRWSSKGSSAKDC